MASKDAGAFIGGVLLGAALGSVVGLLLAPRSGQETRRILKRSVDALPGAAEDVTESAQEQIDRLMHSARRSLDETIHKLNEAIEASRTDGVVPAPGSGNQDGPPTQAAENN